MGTTMRSGSRPTVSRLITTAGRTLPISAPTGGSKFTNQTSPRFGCGRRPMGGLAAGTVAIKLILAEGVESGQIGVGAVFLGRNHRGRLQEDVALVDRQTTNF